MVLIAHHADDLVHQLSHANRVVCIFIIKLGVYDVHGDGTGFVLRQLFPGLFFDQGQAVKRRFVFLRIKIPNLPEKHVLEIHSLLHSGHGKRKMIDEIQIDGFIQFLSERFLRLLHNGVRDLHIDLGRLCQQSIQLSGNIF